MSTQLRLRTIRSKASDGFVSKCFPLGHLEKGMLSVAMLAISGLENFETPTDLVTFSLCRETSAALIREKIGAGRWLQEVAFATV